VLIGKRFRAIREAIGLSEAEVAKSIGPDFQASLLWDFEAGDDNDVDGWSLEDFKAYCHALNVSPTDFVDIPIQDIEQLPLPELVRKRRKEKGYTTRELSDLIGYEESVIEALEGKPSDVTVCLQALKETALWLDIPFRVLVSKL
jgi:transcriptional regulator with XRE-family HTH domain